MEENTKKILRRESFRFAACFFIILIISAYSSTSRTMVDGALHSRFFFDLFILNLIAWIMVYAVLRAAVWAVRTWIKG